MSKKDDTLSSLNGITAKLLAKFPEAKTVSMPFQGKKEQDPAGSLSKAYITAFFIIALISMFVHIIASSITATQQTSIKNSYRINQERALVEQISSSSKKYHSVEERLDLDIMQQAIKNLEENHKNINLALKESSFLNPPSETLNKIYYTDPFFLSKNITAYIEKAKIYASYEVTDKSQERIESYEFLQRNARLLLQPLLNKALADYQSEVIEKIEFYHAIQLGGLLIVLIVLLIEAAFIFNPLVSKTRSYHNMLLKQALEDPLTGLPNRRAFMKRSESALKRAYRDNSGFIIALADLDKFKSINDKYGHDIGDAVLKHFSFVLKKSFRGGDILGRIGGEEFAILLPSANHPVAKDALERFCRDVENTPCPYISKDGVDEVLNYTVSIGYTNLNIDEDFSIDFLLKKADEALYQAKEAGRNRAVYLES